MFDCENIRMAAKADAEAVLAIYRKYITDTTVSFETEVPTVEAFGERMEKVLAGFPWLVYVIDGKVVGYAYASKHRERAAYRWSADLSVYVMEGFHRQHIATKLYTVLLDMLRKQGYYTVYAGVTTPNPRSEAFHKAFGFRTVGVFQNVGFKQGRWCGVTWFELALREYKEAPEEPRGYDAIE